MIEKLLFKWFRFNPFQTSSVFSFPWGCYTLCFSASCIHNNILYHVMFILFIIGWRSSNSIPTETNAVVLTIQCNPPSSSLLTLIVLSVFVSLKLPGLQRQVMPYGLIAISFLNCNLHLQTGQSNKIFLLVNFCSSFNFIMLVHHQTVQNLLGIRLLFQTMFPFCWHLYSVLHYKSQF